MNVYFDVGLPEGFDTVIQGKTINLEPRLTQISPNIGSVAGSLLIAKIEGLGKIANTTKEYWAAHGGTLVNSATGEDICASIKIRAYGEVECVTLNGTVNASTVIAAKSYESNSQ
jgi:hypothetical protein